MKSQGRPLFLFWYRSVIVIVSAAGGVEITSQGLTGWALLVVTVYCLFLKPCSAYHHAQPRVIDLSWASDRWIMGVNLETYPTAKATWSGRGGFAD